MKSALLFHVHQLPYCNITATLTGCQGVSTGLQFIIGSPAEVTQKTRKTHSRNLQTNLRIQNQPSLLFLALTHIILFYIELLLRHTDPQHPLLLLASSVLLTSAVPCHSRTPSANLLPFIPWPPPFSPSFDKQHTKGKSPPNLLSIPYMLIVSVFLMPIYLQFFLQIHHSAAVS